MSFNRVAPSVAPVDGWVRTALILCLQGTFTLSVTVAGLGINFFPVCFSRPLSGFVVVRSSSQAGSAADPDDLRITSLFPASPTGSMYEFSLRPETADGGDRWL
jgi:hypothetical protein